MPALATAAAGFLATHAVARFAVQVAIGFGLNYLAKKIRPKAKESVETPAPQGVSGGIEAGGIVPRSYGRGLTWATFGSLAYANTTAMGTSTPNAWLAQVIALSDLPLDTDPLRGIIVDGAVYMRSSWPLLPLGFQIPNFVDASGANLFVQVYDGRQIFPDPYLVQWFQADPARPWTNLHVGRGVAYAIVWARINPTLFPHGSFPKIKFLLKGIKEYDPRQDETIGGSGGQSWADPETWACSGNPVVGIYNLLAGVRYGGRWAYGAQTIDRRQLTPSSWFAAANECDVPVALQGGGTTPQYLSAGEIDFATQPGDEIDEHLKACNGRLAEIGGTYKIRAGAPGPSVLNVTDGDIIVSEDQSFSGFTPLEAIVNGVRGTYVSPEAGWVEKDLPPVIRPDLEAIDGGRQQIVGIQYARVTVPSQGQRLELSALLEARRERKHALTMPPEAFRYEPLDYFSWTSERNGYFEKLFRIDRVDDKGNLNQRWSVTEADPSDYDWETAFERPIPDAVLELQTPAPQAMVDFNAVGVTIPADNGTAIAGIRLSWDPDVQDVDGIQFEVRLAATDEVVYTSQTDFWKNGALDISANIKASTTYEVRAKYRPASARLSDYSDWITVTTPAVQIYGFELVDASIIASKIADNAITTAKIAAAAVAAGKIAASAVGSNEIAAGSIIAGKIAAGAIQTVDLAAGAVTAAKIAALTITASEIAAGAIEAVKIAADAVTANKIAAGAVVAGKIDTDAIVAGNIQANSVTTVKLISDAVTSIVSSFSAAGTTRAAAGGPHSAVATTELSVVASTTGLRLKISASCQIDMANVGNYCTVRLQRDSTVLADKLMSLTHVVTDVILTGNWLINNEQHVSFDYIETLGAGNYTYSLILLSSSVANGGAGYSIKMSNKFIGVDEVKR